MYGADYLNRAQYSADLIHEKAMEWIDSQSADKTVPGNIHLHPCPMPNCCSPTTPFSRLTATSSCECEERKFGGDQGSRYNPTDIAHAQFAGMITR